MSSATALALGLPLAGIAYLIYRLKDVGRREPYLPGGPPTLPLLGNLHMIPNEAIHYTFTEWAKEYGEIYSLKIGPGTAIVISSAKVANELMDKRSTSTADRPPMHVASIVTGDRSLAFARYGDRWSALRRGAQKILTPQGRESHLPIQQAEATQLMYDLLTRPDDFYTSVSRYSSSVIMSVLFGQRSPTFGTPATKEFYEVHHLWLHALEPGAHPPIDMLPFLQKVPERFAAWKRLCTEVRRLQRKLYFGLLTNVENRIARGEANGCWMETVCEHMEEWKLDRESVGYLGGVLIEGGSETTASILHTLILALVNHPEVQTKAQKEIDRVVGRDRAPVLQDIESLPYCQAIILEIHRWRPVTPLALPHSNTQDEVYNGHLIPKGTTIFVNTWGIFHDPNVYENPEEFNPDRFLESEFGTKPEAREGDKDRKNSYIFGYGRRICIGMQLGNNSLRINTVNLLWGFNFLKAKDASGKEITPDDRDCFKGLTTGPNPFKCKIVPRSQRHKEIIERRFAEATEVFEKFEHELSPEDRAFVDEQRKGH